MNTKIGSTVSNRNTGKAAFAYNPALWKGYFLAPVTNKTVTAADMDDMKAFLNAQLHHADPIKRWHQFSRIDGFEIKTEAASQQTLTNGRAVIVDRSHPMYEFQFVDGGKGNHMAKRTFNGLEEYFVIFPYDANNNLEGCVDEDDPTAMTGRTLSIHYSHDAKPATRTTVAEYKVLVQLADAADENENSFAVKCNVNPAKLVGVRDVRMTDITPQGAAAGVFEISFTEGDGDVNLVTILGSALVNVANFTAKNEDTGADITFTVDVNTAGTGLKFTLSTADPDYDQGTNAKIAMSSVPTLATNGCKYFEGRDANGNFYVAVEMS